MQAIEVVNLVVYFFVLKTLAQITDTATKTSLSIVNIYVDT